MDGPEGALLLTAGLGRRAEPLSFSRPKALLPVGDGDTLLSRLAASLGDLGPSMTVVNASRCRRLIENEMSAVVKAVGDFRIAFEERPLGVVGTLRRLSMELAVSGGYGGPWIVSNTDMITDLEPRSLLRYHLEAGSDWTVAVGDAPSRGGYGPLHVAGDGAFRSGGAGTERHYLGICVLSERMLRLSSGAHGGFFTDLVDLARSAGMRQSACESRARWLDLGDASRARAAILSAGGYLAPEADIDDGAVLKGVNYIGAGCRIVRGATVEDSVLLDGSAVLGGAVRGTILAWDTAKRGSRIA